MLVIGLTGGIGSGKSTVARIFADQGATIIDMDVLSRELTEPHTPALAAITEHFGTGVLNDDGSLNRAALRNIVFTRPDERIWLESLLHPPIWKATEQKIAQCSTRYCIVVIPLLIEKKPNPIIQRILVVDATPAQQLTRAKLRDSHTADSIPAILNAQSNREKRLERADDIINNDGNPNALLAQVKALHRQYLSLS